jgi:hypothetical protein
VFCPEFLQVLLVGLELRGLLILSKPGVVLLFCAIGLSFARLTFVCWEDLPSFADNLGNFCEREVLSFQKLSDFCVTLVLYHGILRTDLRFEKMT